MKINQDRRKKAPVWVWVVVLVAIMALLWFIISYSRLNNPVDRIPSIDSTSGQNNTAP